MIEGLRGFLAVVATVEALGVALVCGAVLFLALAHFGGSKIDFANTLNDRDGRTSLRKFGEWMALLASTWVLIYLTKTGQINETYYGAYLVVWVARTAIGPILGAKAEAIAKAAEEPR